MLPLCKGALGIALRSTDRLCIVSKQNVIGYRMKLGGSSDTRRGGRILFSELQNPSTELPVIVCTAKCILHNDDALKKVLRQLDEITNGNTLVG